ncbi:MAG: malonic semialdehyde reductase, partial [Proteobacteria bacterium]|nr:malonic semialdehyde reductase [Pseudomonadota bacterium]
MANLPPKDDIDLVAQESIRNIRGRIDKLDDNAVDLMFREARSFNGWTDERVSDEQIKAIYDIMKFGPTSANCIPMRITFVKSDEAKKRLEPIMFERNRAKTMQAPVIAILGNDLEFGQKSPFFAPHRPDDVKGRMEENPNLKQPWAIKNGSLQAAYFMMAVRAVGLDVGPMQGLDMAACDEEF